MGPPTQPTWPPSGDELGQPKAEVRVLVAGGGDVVPILRESAAKGRCTVADAVQIRRGFGLLRDVRTATGAWTYRLLKINFPQGRVPAS